jgi:hypothetical protein
MHLDIILYSLGPDVIPESMDERTAACHVDKHQLTYNNMTVKKPGIETKKVVNV